jgi:hypothetical protein
MKKIVFLVLLLSSLSLLFACAAPGGGGTGGPKPPTGGGANTDCKVTVFFNNTSATVKTQNPTVVKSGESAVFRIELSSTAVFRSASAGSYDYKTGLLTVPSVTKDTRVDFVCEEVGYDTTGEYKILFAGDTSKGDSISHPDSTAPIQPGTRITAKAGNMNSVFIGWSAASTIADGGKILSTDREYSFDLSPDLVQMGTLILYPNYEDTNVYYYDTNGGTVNAASRNLTASSTYQATRQGELLRVAISEAEMKQLGCASLFYDDGTFARDGYVLLEYNTKADGTGEGYSLGSKFPMNAASKVLYCIWAKVDAQGAFEYSDFSYARPSGITAANTPGWHEHGVQITGYSGNAETLVIPETLGGKPVISIASGAFSNCSAAKTLVLSKNLLMVEDGAFRNFSALKTVYCSDSIYKIGNGAIDASGYATLKTFILNATTPPRFSKGDGAFARKFCRVLANADKPRIIMIAGSSARQGFSTPYLEKMLDGAYVVINFGTTRTTQGFMYLEAMQHYANANDIILYAPENSSYMMGEGTLYWKTLRDMEGMYNIFRYIDISGYSNVFGAITEYNSGYAEVPGVDACYAPRFKYAPGTYEDILKATADDEYGDYQHQKRNGYRSSSQAAYQDTYVITLNNRFKSMYDTGWDNKIEDYWKTDDWKDPYDKAWCNIDDPYFVKNMNRAINAAKSTGAKVYFSFCPMDASRLCEDALADIDAWCRAYENMIESTYAFDGVLGNVKDYFMNHEYFYDNAFHPNDYGRTVRTYQVYKDLSVLFENSNPHTVDYIRDGVIAGCRVETDYDGIPNFPAFP